MSISEASRLKKTPLYTGMAVNKTMKRVNRDHIQTHVRILEVRSEIEYHVMIDMSRDLREAQILLKNDKDVKT